MPPAERCTRSRTVCEKNERLARMANRGRWLLHHRVWELETQQGIQHAVMNPHAPARIPETAAGAPPALNQQVERLRGLQALLRQSGGEEADEDLRELKWAFEALQAEYGPQEPGSEIDKSYAVMKKRDRTDGERYTPLIHSFMKMIVIVD